MYRVAIIGYRHQGKLHHAPAFAKHPDCRIVAVCDLVEERAREGAARYGVPAYQDADEMLAREEIDIVDIPVGEQYRSPLVMKALGLGKHVFTEKPLAGAQGQMRIRLSDVPTARAMVDEWRKHDKGFGICFCMHSGSNVRWAKRVIASGEFGATCLVHAHCAWGSWNHIIDLFRFLGGEVAEVFAYHDGSEQWCDRAVAVRFESGAVGTLMTSARLTLQYELKWVGERGEMLISDIGGTAWARSHDRYEYRMLNEQGSTTRSTYDRMFDEHIADFVDCITTGRPFDADGWAGLRHMEIDAAISESLLAGARVRVERYLPEMGRTVFSDDRGHKGCHSA